MPSAGNNGELAPARRVLTQPLLVASLDQNDGDAREPAGRQRRQLHEHGVRRRRPRDRVGLAAGTYAVRTVTPAGWSATGPVGGAHTPTLTAGGTATAGSDSAAASGTLTFLPGETTTSVNVSTTGDDTFESDETFTLTLSGIDPRRGGPQVVPGWAAAISAGPPDESGQTLTFEVATDNPALFAVQPAIDPATGTLTYAPGGGPRVFVLSGALVSGGRVDAAQAAPVGNFFVAGNASDRGGEPGGFFDLEPFGGAVMPGGVYVG